jgi:tetratricopeptide (TPR) repeat protein
MGIIRFDSYPQFAEAYTNFQKAIALDRNFARPYVGLFELRLRQNIPSLGLFSRAELENIARELKRLGPNLAATHCAQSVLYASAWNYPVALKCAEQAVRADSNYELGHTWYGFALCVWGHTVKAREQLAMSEDLMPAKATAYHIIGQTYYMERDYTKAIAWEKKALDLDPHETVAHYTIGQSWLARGDYTNALASLENCHLNMEVDAESVRNRYRKFREALDKGGPHGYWMERWRLTLENPQGEFYWKAVIQIHLGDTNRALYYLTKSYQTRERWADGSTDGPLSYLLLDHYWEGLRGDPQFKAILDGIGFTTVSALVRR